MLRTIKRVPEGRFPSENNDCGVCVLANATDTPYHVAHKTLALLGRKNGQGTRWLTLTRALRNLDLLEREPDMYLSIPLRNFTIPKYGRWIVANTTHYFAIVDGQVINNGDWNIGGRSIIRYVVQVKQNPDLEPYHEPKNSDLPAYDRPRRNRKIRWAAICSCRDSDNPFWLSTTIKNKMVRGQSRYCPTCKRGVSLTGARKVIH